MKYFLKIVKLIEIIVQIEILEQKIPSKNALPT